MESNELQSNISEVSLANSTRASLPSLGDPWSTSPLLSHRDSPTKLAAASIPDAIRVGLSALIAAVESVAKDPKTAVRTRTKLEKAVALAKLAMQVI